MNPEPLKYHYSNPKFEGLPWPADKKAKQPKRKKRKRGCVKKVFESEAEVRREVEELNRTTLESHFFHRWCESCAGWHVQRVKM